MKKQEKKETYIKAVEDMPREEERRKVSDIVKILEKSLNINHFLNTRFNKQNVTLCEKLMEKSESNKKDISPNALDSKQSFMESE